MITVDIIEKYIKIKALAEQGAMGEKDNARRIMKKMEKEYPGLEKAVVQFEAQNNPEPEEPSATSWTPPPTPKPQPAKGGSKYGGNWEELFNFARSAVNNAYDFATHVANAWVGRQLAEDYVTTSIRETKTGNVSIIFRVPDGVLDYAANLNLVQKQAFRQVLHELLDDQMDELIGTMDEQEEEEDEED